MTCFRYAKSMKENSFSILEHSFKETGVAAGVTRLRLGGQAVVDRAVSEGICPP